MAGDGLRDAAEEDRPKRAIAPRTHDQQIGLPGDLLENLGGIAAAQDALSFVRAGRDGVTL